VLYFRNRFLLLSLTRICTAAGAGKTILTYVLPSSIHPMAATYSRKPLMINSSTIVEMVQHRCLENGFGFAFFYCRFDQPESKDPVNIFGSLLKQLSLQKEEIPDCVNVLYQERNTLQPNLHQVLVALKDVVQNAFAQTYFVIDAVDECGSQLFLDAVVSISSSLNKCLRFLITGRREKEIEVAFRDKMSLFIQEGDIAADIKLHVRSEIQKRPTLMLLPDGVKARITRALVQGARGM